MQGIVKNLYRMKKVEVKRRKLKDLVIPEVPENNEIIVRKRNQKAIDARKRRYGLLKSKNKKYDPEMCETVVEMMKEGKSRYEVAAELGVTTATIAQWELNNPDFSEALHIGEEASRAWWEKQARDNLIVGTGVKFNTTLWTFIMKNRFGWADASRVEEKRMEIKYEIDDKKKEIERTSTVKHTAKVLEILRGVGVIQSSTNQPIETKAEQVHKT